MSSSIAHSSTIFRLNKRKIPIKINDIPCVAREGMNILEAAAEENIYIPRLCGNESLPPVSKCGICIVKLGDGTTVRACSTQVKEGMEIFTNDLTLFDESKKIFVDYSPEILDGKSSTIDVLFTHFRPEHDRGKSVQKTETQSIVFDFSLCIKCNCCFRACIDLQGIGALNENDHTVNVEDCISCGACVTFCPTTAMREKREIPKLLHAFSVGKIVAIQFAPAVRVSLAELFGKPVGTICTGKMISAARKMGFRYVFDTTFGADLTVYEEANEFLTREKRPMFTSCCPGFVNFIERYHPDLIPYLTTTKSPMAITGAVIKNHFAMKMCLKNIFVVFVGPCTAKKDEICRHQIMNDVDCALTTREFGEMIENYEIDWDSLNDKEEFDTVAGEGWTVEFGASGGVATGVMKYLCAKYNVPYEVVFENVPLMTGLKETTITIDGKELKFAICSGISTAANLIDTELYLTYDFIEVMSCPLGCVNGGGQPKISKYAQIHNRSKAIRNIFKNANKTVLDNSAMEYVYTDYLGDPGVGLAHKLLHTSFQERKVENKK
uniref:Fe-hydrogenase n=1 Tax=Pseudotrichonympha grassii TaxID=104083 RepID=A8J6B7_9EUKA|nr:Fe-hydrogenase [Pseudotrichonympha grassii]